MRTVRRAVRELVTMGSVIALGEATQDADDEPVRRGPVWITVQVVVAAGVLGVALLVGAALGGGDVERIPGGLALWAIPATLLVAPFVVHLLARPARAPSVASPAHRPSPGSWPPHAHGDDFRPPRRSTLTC